MTDTTLLGRTPRWSSVASRVKVLLLVYIYRLTRNWEGKRPLVVGWVMALATAGAVLVGLNLAVVLGVVG